MPIYRVPLVVTVEVEGETMEDAEQEAFLLRKGSGRVSVASYNYEFDGHLTGVLKPGWYSRAADHVLINPDE